MIIFEPPGKSDPDERSGLVRFLIATWEAIKEFLSEVRDLYPKRWDL